MYDRFGLKQVLGQISHGSGAIITILTMEQDPNLWLLSLLPREERKSHKDNSQVENFLHY